MALRCQETMILDMSFPEVRPQLQSRRTRHACHSGLQDLSMLPHMTNTDNTIPLCVDLDGTLIRTDLLWESMVRLLRKNPLFIFALPFWWMQGRARLKAEIGKRVKVDPSALPYVAEVLEFIRREAANGRPVFLVTASDAELARETGKYVGVFREVLASDGATNLRGATKAARLVELFGEKGFDYAGDSSVDFPVWEKAREAIVVSDKERLRKVATRAFSSSRFSFGALWRAMRPGRWIKNLTVFVPILAVHKWGNSEVWLRATVAFVAFCLCASGMYILDDIADLEADRRDPIKKQGPFASGELFLPFGLFGGPILVALGAVVGLWLSWKFVVVLGMYVVLATGFSSKLMRMAPVKVLRVAGLYVIRLVAGYVATGFP